MKSYESLKYEDNGIFLIQIPWKVRLEHISINAERNLIISVSSNNIYVDCFVTIFTTCDVSVSEFLLIVSSAHPIENVASSAFSTALALKLKVYIMPKWMA